MTGGWVVLALPNLALRCQMPCSGSSFSTSLVLTNCSSGQMPFDSFLTSMGLVGLTSLISRKFFWVDSFSSLNRNSAGLFDLPRTYAITIKICSTNSQGSGVTLFVRKNFVSNLLCALTTTGSVAPQKLCPNSFNAIYEAWNSFG